MEKIKSAVARVQIFLKLILRQSRTVKKLIVLSVFVSLLLFAVELVFAWSMQFFLSKIGILNSQSSFNLPFFSGAWGGFTVFIIAGILRSASLSLKAYCQQAITIYYTVEGRLNVSSFAIRNAEKLNISDVLSTYSDLVHRSGGFINGFLALTYNLVVGFCYLSACFYFSIEGSFASLFLVFILMLPLVLFESGISLISERISIAWKKSNQVLTDALRNHLFIRIHGLIEDEVKLVSKYVIDHRDFFKKYIRIYAVRSIYTPIVGIFVLGLIGVLSYEYGFGVNSAVLISFFYIFIRFAQAAGDLVNSWGECQLNYDAIKNLEYWISAEEKVIENVDSIGPKISQISNVSLKNVSYSFSNDLEILSNVSLDLKKGDVLYIHGESGSGKSTLISLMLGILTPTKGEVSIDGISIDKIRTQIWGLVSYSGPSPLLKQGSLKENLLYGNSKSSMVTDEEILALINEVGLSKGGGTFKELSFNIDDNVGLSTGQKQRISIARALLMKPQFLILDEATSNLDKDNEQLVINYIQKERANLISVIVSHRDSFKSICNKELKLETIEIPKN